MGDSYTTNDSGEVLGAIYSGRTISTQLAANYGRLASLSSIETIQSNLATLDAELSKALPGFDFTEVSVVVAQQKLARQRLNRLVGARKAMGKGAGG